MDLVTGAMGSLASKLLQLLKEEYNLHKGLRAEVESLVAELRSTHIALSMVAQVPLDQLHPQVRDWARDVREASYDMEDILDCFLVHVDDGAHQPAKTDKSKVERLREKMGKLFRLSKFKARHNIMSAIEDIKKRVEDMAQRRNRYMTKDLLANPAAGTSIDRRLLTPDIRAPGLVEIDEPREALIKMLLQGDTNNDEKMKIVSIVGFGGLGKTTLAKAVYDKITVDMNISYTAFVPVGQNPNFKKVFRDILLGLTGEQYMNQSNFTLLDELQLIDRIQKFLQKKRYFIVIDDIWEVSSWNIIKRALDDNDLGSKIIITTRRSDVANQVHCSYEIKPLSHESSKLLLYGRIFDSRDKCPEQFSELSDTILKKCAGVPLAVITIASLLANKSEDITEWQNICNAIGQGLISRDDDDNMCNMRKILSLSYYDLPAHLKTCFLYLSIYPEDCEINRDRLIWRWIAEGFIQPQENGDNGLFNLGESYFNQLINRSLMQPVCHIDNYGITYGCRVHDMILDLVCYLSREENFVTILKDGKGMIPSGRSKARRLSLKDNTLPETGVSQVRSIAIFSPSIHSLASILCFNILRVLDLEGCRSNKLDFNVGKLIHLRYLGLAGTKLSELPGGIEKLRFLEVIKPGPCELPVAIFGLRQLMCLDRGKFCPRPGHLLGNLESLQVLNFLSVEDSSCVGAVEALGHLTQLRDLNIQIDVVVDESIHESFMNSIGKLRQLRSLIVSKRKTSSPSFWENWEISKHLRTLTLFGYHVSFHKLPSWISPASLPLLSVLHIDDVRCVLPEDIQILGKLPLLCRLVLTVRDDNVYLWPQERFTVSAGAFPCLRWCRITNVVAVPSMFPHGAMPRVETLTFSLPLYFFSTDIGLFNMDDLAMEHLPSLRRVCVKLRYPYCDSSLDRWGNIAEKVKQALMHAACVHPNCPSITVS